MLVICFFALGGWKRNDKNKSNPNVARNFETRFWPINIDRKKFRERFCVVGFRSRFLRARVMPDKDKINESVNSDGQVSFSFLPPLKKGDHL